MCYAIPAKLIEIKTNNTGVVDYFGEHRNILLDDTEELKVGDYVFAQGGILVRKIEEKDALEILEAWKDIFFELKKTDEALAKVDEENLPPNVLGVLQKINLRKSITKAEMLALMQMRDAKELNVLYEIANNVRQREHGNASCVHGIIEFSNHCGENCYYCGIRRDQKINRYRMTPEEIIATAKNAVDEHGFKAFVLQSGEDLWYDDEKLFHIVKEIRKLGTLVFVSLGSRDFSTYKRCYEAGARAVLLRFETSNKDIFAKLRPGTNIEERVELIKKLKDLGYILATGFMVGLPDETEEDVINNIALTKYLSPDMYSFGPFIPTENTPLANVPKVLKDLVLKTTAIARLNDPACNILVTTALETIDPSARREALLAGANSMMINLTPVKYRNLYSIYDNRAGSNTEIINSIKETVALLSSLGRAPTDIGLV